MGLSGIKSFFFSGFVGLFLLSPLSSGEELNFTLNMNEQRWSDGDVEFEGIFVDDGNNSWGNLITDNFYMQTTSAAAVVDIDLPLGQTPDLEKLIRIQFDARFLESPTHSYLVFGEDADLSNAIWFGFNEQQFLAGTGSELSIADGRPLGNLTEFAVDRSYADDSRIGVRIGYDPATEQLTNFQVDSNHDGQFEDELLSQSIDFSASDLTPESWFLVTYMGGAGGRIDDVVLDQINPYGDYNEDLEFNQHDASLICSAINTNGIEFDYDEDGSVTEADLNQFLSDNRSLLSDFDFNGNVGFADFLILSGSFGADEKTYAEGDATCDGTVGFDDFLVVSRLFNNYARRAESVPEPSAGVFVCLAVVAFGACRQRRS